MVSLSNARRTALNGSDFYPEMGLPYHLWRKQFVEIYYVPSDTDGNAYMNVAPPTERYATISIFDNKNP